MSEESGSHQKYDESYEWDDEDDYEWTPGPLDKNQVSFIFSKPLDCLCPRANRRDPPHRQHANSRSLSFSALPLLLRLWKLGGQKTGDYHEGTLD
jgi:hypothetical protein